MPNAILKLYQNLQLPSFHHFHFIIFYFYSNLPMAYKNYIERRPDVMLGKPVIKGTRITVELIMRKFAGGYTVEQLLAACPQLNHEQISAVLKSQ